MNMKQIIKEIKSEFNSTIKYFERKSIRDVNCAGDLFTIEGYKDSAQKLKALSKIVISKLKEQKEQENKINIPEIYSKASQLSMVKFIEYFENVVLKEQETEENIICNECNSENTILWEVIHKCNDCDNEFEI
jgi:hypothetical protein